MKKKFLLFMLVSIVAVMTFSIMTSAASTEIIDYYDADTTNEISWTLYEDGKLEITGKCDMDDFAKEDAPWYIYNNYVLTVEIKKGVTGIGANAFYSLKKLKSVSIPETVEKIGMNAFYKCVNLSSITIPSEVTTISASAFSGCSSLTSVELPEGLERIRSNAFENCKKLSEITFYENLETIGISAFAGCTMLDSVYFYGDAPSLGEDAFSKVSDDFTVYYIKGAAGYTKGDWASFDSEAFNGKNNGSKDDSEDDIMYGDVNGDGKINDTDIRYLFNALGGKSSYAKFLKFDESDFNGDGQVTVADHIYLSRYLDGWKGYKPGVN